MVLDNTQKQTTVTTRTTEVPSQTINKEAIVTNVMEKPVLENVIEKKHVEVHHKPVVQEVHQQKIIEIEKQNLVQNVQKEAQFSQARAETRYEEIGSAQLGEQERLRLAQLNQAQAPKIVQQGSTRQVQEQETVAQVIRQENIERHVQPLVTEVREQKVVQEVVHPVVRTVHEAPIIREVTGASTIQKGTFQETHLHQQAPLQQGLTQQSGLRGETMVTTQTKSGLNSGTTTTSNIGAPIQTEQVNMNRHEHKLINKEGGNLSGVERSNLVQHEQVVNAVAHQGAPLTGTTHATTTTGTTHNAHRTGFNEPLDDESNKPGFFTRMKDKLHLGHHDTTTETKKH
jgi:hypothetical protein